MGHTVQVDDMITQIREYSDMERSQFVTDAEILRRMNLNYRNWYNKIVNSFEQYFTIPGTITTVNGQDDYDVPSDFYKLVGLDYVDGNKTYKIDPITINERNIKLWHQDWPSRYLLRKQTITLYPTPSAVHTIRVMYVPVPEDLVAGGDLQAHNGWHDYIIIKTAIQLLDKEESDSRLLRADLAETEQIIMDSYHQRDTGNAQRIRDVFEESDMEDRFLVGYGQ